MPRTGMSAEAIRDKAIQATLTRMRLFGFEKVNLSDVAKDLGVSHAALYAHFTDKAALLDAVTERWLRETDAVLEAVCLAKGEPIRKIERWFVKMYRLKRQRALSDPEPYRAFEVAAQLSKPFVVAHLLTVHRQLTELISEASGCLTDSTPARQAELLYEAMAAFHHPKLVLQHAAEERERLLKRVLHTMLAGLGLSDKAPCAIDGKPLPQASSVQPSPP